MTALCQALLRLRDTSRAGLVVVHHVRKSIRGRRQLSAAHPASPQLATVELRFQFRYAAPSLRGCWN